MERRTLLRLIGALVAAGAAAAVPVAIHIVTKRRARPPHAPRWGRSRRFAGKFGPIVFQELGDGEPIVLLHAFGPGYDSSQWRATAEALASSYRVVVPDLPGWGRSPATLPHCGLYVEALIDFLTGVVREPAVVCAAGLPAAYALKVAQDRPPLVRALALVSPEGLDGAEAGSGGARSGRQARQARPGISSLGKKVLRHLLGVPLLRTGVLDLLTSRAAVARHLRREYAVPERVDAAVLDHHYRVSHLPATREALAAYLRGELECVPLGGAAARSDRPLWLALGERHGPKDGEGAGAPAGQPAPPRRRAAEAELWNRQLPQARVERFTGSGRLPHVEAPVAFGRALDRFVATLPAVPSE